MIVARYTDGVKRSRGVPARGSRSLVNERNVDVSTVTYLPSLRGEEQLLGLFPISRQGLSRWRGGRYRVGEPRDFWNG
jgi:hypothetical protein